MEQLRDVAYFPETLAEVRDETYRDVGQLLGDRPTSSTHSLSFAPGNPVQNAHVRCQCGTTLSNVQRSLRGVSACSLLGSSLAEFGPKGTSGQAASVSALPAGSSPGPERRRDEVIQSQDHVALSGIDPACPRGLRRCRRPVDGGLGSRGGWGGRRGEMGMGGTTASLRWNQEGEREGESEGG